MYLNVHFLPLVLDTPHLPAFSKEFAWPGRSSQTSKIWIKPRCSLIILQVFHCGPRSPSIAPLLFFQFFFFMFMCMWYDVYACVCVCEWVRAHTSTHACEDMYKSEVDIWSLAHLLTLFIDAGSLHWTQSLGTWLVSLASLLQGSPVSASQLSGLVRGYHTHPALLWVLRIWTLVPKLAACTANVLMTELSSSVNV